MRGALTSLARRIWRDAQPAPPRWPRLASTYSLGWLVVFALVMLGRPEGDYAIAGDVQGYTVMAAALGLVLVAIVGFTKDPSDKP